WFGIFRMGIGTEFYPGVQFSKDPEALNQFYRLPIFSNNKNYSAELVNKSNLTVVIKAVVKKSDKVTQSFGLAPK
ncbi:MAG: hypothetical protein EBS24_05820, partial [Chitinophagia bacterium]|nr:hypothetical protein [Chitinophagia bacterium]